MQKEKVFTLFDKSAKGFLTRHEFKLCFIYIFGFKPSKCLLEEIWKRRIHCTIPNSKLLSKGISLDYFNELLNDLNNTISAEQKLRAEFSVIDKQDRGFVTKEDFAQLLNENLGRFLPESQRLVVFRALDLDGDGKISFADYQSLFKDGCVTQL